MRAILLAQSVGPPPHIARPAWIRRTVPSSIFDRVPRVHPWCVSSAFQFQPSATKWVKLSVPRGWGHTPCERVTITGGCATGPLMAETDVAVRCWRVRETARDASEVVANADSLQITLKHPIDAP